MIGTNMDTITKKLSKKSGSEMRQRKHCLHCRLLPDEKATINTRASELGISASRYLREAALGMPHRPPKRRLPTFAEKSLAQVLGQLGRVGNNLNQLTQISHIAGQVPDSLRLNALLHELRAVMSSVVEVLE